MELKDALEKSIIYLEKSRDSIYSHLTVAEIIQQLEEELARSRIPSQLTRTVYLYCLDPQEAFKILLLTMAGGKNFLKSRVL